MDELLYKRVNELEDENVALNDGASKKKEKIEELHGFHLDFTPSYPRCTDKLGELSKNVEKLSPSLEKLAKAKEDIREAGRKIDDLGALTKEIRRVLVRVNNFDRTGRYDRALEAIDTLMPQLEDERFAKMNFIALAKEALAYDRCAVLTHKAESNIANGLLPMGKEELLEFRAFAEKLATDNNPFVLKQAYIDEAYGLIYCYAYRAVNPNLPTLEMFRSLKETHLLMNEKTETPSALTAARGKRLHRTYAKVFNHLSFEYFENEGNYDKALEIFQGRDLLEKAEIEHYAYNGCENEREFYIAFEKASALKKDPTAFKDRALVMGQRAATGDELAMVVLANIISMPLLDAAKFNTALRATLPFNFVQMLCFFEECVRLGIDKEKAALVFGELEEKDRTGDLELMASALNYLNFHIDASLRARFDKLRASLLRSPKAHRVKRKSNDENLRLLFGEEKDSYPAPVGKPLKNRVVNAWSKARLFFYWVGMICLPLLVAVGAWIVMQFVLGLGNDSYTLTLVYAAPIMLFTCFLFMVGAQWFNRDEWASAKFRRAMMILAMVEGLASLAYFALPEMMGVLKFYSLPLFASSLLTGLFAMIVFHEQRRLPRYLTFIPFVVIVVAACIFLVLGGINGAIIF